MDKEDKAARTNILGSMVFSVLLLIVIAVTVSVFHLNMPVSDQIVNLTENQTVDQSEEVNRSTIIISMPLSKSASENISIEKTSPFLGIRICSEQDSNIMFESGFRSNISETRNISLYINGTNALDNRLNRPILLSANKSSSINTYINRSILTINGGTVVFDIELREEENIIDQRRMSCQLSGGGGSSVSISASVPIVPTPIPTPVLTRIEVTPSNVSVNKGNTKVFIAEGFDQFGNSLEVVFKWVSSNQTIGTVDSNGEFEAKSAGAVVITASNGSISGNATVTVSEVPISTPIPTPTSAPTQTPVITPISTPTAKPTETSTPVPTLTSTPVPISILTTIIIKPSVAHIFEGGTIQFEAAAYDQFNQTMSVVINWTSSNHAAGNISETGMFTAIKPGKTIITASNGSVKKNATVTVQKELKPTPTRTPVPTLTPTPTVCNIL